MPSNLSDFVYKFCPLDQWLSPLFKKQRRRFRLFTYRTMHR